MRVDLMMRFKWFEIANAQLLDPERSLSSLDNKMLFTYPNREEALAAMSQYIDKHGLENRQFILTELLSLE